VLAELAASLVEGVGGAGVVSTLGGGLDGVMLGAGSGLKGVGLGTLAVLAGLVGTARGCDALDAFATVLFATALPASATIAGLSLAAVAVPTSAGTVFDAVVAGCAVVAG
jgi:hypothetical protein